MEIIINLTIIFVLYGMFRVVMHQNRELQNKSDDELAERDKYVEQHDKRDGGIFK